MAKEIKTLVDDVPSGTARRTPERAALAEAIAKRDAARERIATLEGAIAAAYEQWVKSWAPRRVAEVDLAEAKKNLPKSSWERIQPGADGALVAAEEARRRLEATEGECEKHKIIHADLEKELADARQSASFADNVDRAVTSATCGSGTPVARYMIPANSTNGAGNNVDLGPVGVAYGTGITYCVTTGIADTDTTAPAASTFLVNLVWK